MNHSSSMPKAETALATLSVAFLVAAAVSPAPSPALLALLLSISTSSALAAWIRVRTETSSSSSCSALCRRRGGDGGDDGGIGEGTERDGAAPSAHYHLQRSRRTGGAADAKAESTTTEVAAAAEEGILLPLWRIDRGLLRPSRLAVLLVFAPGAALAVLLVVRLLASPYHFGGDASSLDFGPKYGNAGGDGDDDATEEVEANVAFTNEFNSYGHALQGFLASILAYPAVAGALARLCDSCIRGASGRRGPASAPTDDVGGEKPTTVVVSAVVLAGLASSCMTLYPSYNFFKRLARHGDTFATSSYVNNATEWTLGFALGASLGMLATALVRRRLLASALATTLDRGDPSFVYGKVEDYSDGVDGDASCCRCFSLRAILRGVAALRWLLGLSFALSVFLCALLMGYTWNSCAGGGTDCLNYVEGGQPPLGVMVGLGLVPIVVYGVAFYASREY